MEPKNIRPTSILKFVKAQNKSGISSSSLSRKNEALAKMTADYDKLKEEFNLLKYEARFTNLKSIKLYLKSIPISYRMKKACVEVSVQTDPCVMSDASTCCVLAQTDCSVAYTQTDITGTESSESVKFTKANRVIHSDYFGDLNDHQIEDMANQKTIDTFDFPNLSPLDVKLLQVKLFDKVAFSELVREIIYRFIRIQKYKKIL